MNTRLTLPYWLAQLLALAAGALAPLALAPWNLWPLALISLAVFAACLHGRGTGRCYWLALLYGVGLYGVGASWVYVSISQFGSTSKMLSLVLTSGFVVGLAAAFALPLLTYGKWFSRSPAGLLLGFPAVWVLGEWMRSWFLTGFPWLYVGYGHLHTPLAGWAPVLGVFGVSLGVALTSVLATYLLLYRPRWQQKALRYSVIATLVIWLAGFAMRFIDWTELDEKPVRLGMAQPSIPQDRKWDPDFLDDTFKIFNELSTDLWQYDWVIWPEAAIPLLYHEAVHAIKELDQRADQSNTTFITGILYDEADTHQFYNTIIALGKGDGITYKMRLVPFGEYVPLENWLRGTIEFFDLPTSFIHPGPGYTNGLQTPAGEIAPSICYEVVYPDLVAQRALTAQFLLTISNDAWFGHSIGPIQHFQMAQMRALETGRYMIRSTNNGISGIIDPKGNTLVQGGRFTRESLTGEVYAARGNTPFMLFGSWPVVFFCLLALPFIWRRQRVRASARSVAEAEAQPPLDA